VVRGGSAAPAKPHPELVGVPALGRPEDDRPPLPAVLRLHVYRVPDLPACFRIGLWLRCGLPLRHGLVALL
jgi:hypothetical protein